MNDSNTLLACLQNADSFFPGGGMAFSWGLEALVTDRVLQRAEDITALLEDQLRYRWAACDRCALRAASRTREVDDWASIDAKIEAGTLAQELREGSRRAGASLLGVHERIGTPGASDYGQAIRAGRALGHLSVVQGVAWRGSGMSEEAIEAASAHAFSVALLGAAIRLGVIGHLHAQRSLLAMRSVIAELLDEPPEAVEDMYSNTFASEIASMRHESQISRLFAN
jgi:urease accessory protein